MMQHSEPKDLEVKKFLLAKEKPTQGILSGTT